MSILEEKRKFFSLWGLSFVCHTWNVYQSASIPKNGTTNVTPVTKNSFECSNSFGSSTDI